ncbi:Stearoyl-CoA desaturase 5, partial [Dufourea novaeangliae]
KKQDIKWAAVLWYIHLHVLGVYAIWLMITSAKWMTVLFTLFITSIGCLGVTAGAHRLWAHRSYEASGLLRLFLTLAHTLAGVVRFLYSHYMGNFQSPKVDYEQAKIDIDMRDIENDGYVWAQKKIPPDSISVFLVRKSKSLAYHYMILKSGEFGTYDSGCSTFFIKMWYELGLVNNLITTTSNDIRDVLHQVARKKITMDGALNKLKEMSEYNMKKNRLV